MLPPGHIAAGYLVAKTVLHFSPALPAVQRHWLLFWGAFFGFAPDLDMFYLFYRVKRLTVTDDDPNHRELYTHAPVLWLIAGLSIFFLAVDPFWKIFGLLVWLGSWSHFLLDTIQHGVMWAWPVRRKPYAFIGGLVKSHLRPIGFWNFWVQFIRFYATEMAVSFWIDVGIITAALVFFFR